jgi:hypothetical protein
MRIDALKGRVAGANRPRRGSSGALPTGSRANGFGIASNYALRQRMQAPEGGQMLARARAGEYVSAVRHSSSKRMIGRNGSLLLWNRPVTAQSRPSSYCVKRRTAASVQSLRASFRLGCARQGGTRSFRSPRTQRPGPSGGRRECRGRSHGVGILRARQHKTRRLSRNSAIRDLRLTTYLHKSTDN